MKDIVFKRIGGNSEVGIFISSDGNGEGFIIDEKDSGEKFFSPIYLPLLPESIRAEVLEVKENIVKIFFSIRKTGDPFQDIAAKNLFDNSCMVIGFILRKICD